MFEFSTELPEATRVAVVEYGDRYTLRFTLPNGGTVALSMAPAEFDMLEDFMCEAARSGAEGYL